MLVFAVGINTRGSNGEKLQLKIAKLYSTKQFDQTGVIYPWESVTSLAGRPVSNQKVTEINAPINVACVFAASAQGINELGFNSMVYAGLQKAQTDGLCTFVYKEPVDSSEYLGMLDNYAASGIYDLIVTIGYDQISAVNITAINYPAQPIVLIDQVVVQGNVRSVLFEEQEGSFLAGAMAGLMTQTGKVGFIGGMDIPLIREFWAGYKAGVFYEKNDSYIEVIEDFVGAWGDPVTGKNIAEAMWAKGVDIIYVAAGASGFGALESTNEQGGGFYAIGVDADQDFLFPGRILCSMMKRVDIAVYNAIQDVYNSNWSADVQSLRMAENGVGLSPLTYTKDEIGFDKIQEVNVTVRNKIISGEITVPTNSTNLAQWMTNMNIVTKIYTPHGFISITSDAQLNSSFPGMGTIADPIRIEGYNITTSAASPIAISDTSLYFRIANNILNGLFGSNPGIYFHNVTHGIIEENIIYHNGYDGIWVESSDYNSIINNTVYRNSWTGIKLGWSSNNNSVVNNAVFGNFEYGIWLGEGGSSNDNIIVSNMISNNKWGGINLDESSQNFIFKNLIHRNPANGITLSSSDLNIIEYNTIYKNNEGISLTSSHNTTISYNLVYNNEWVGIQLSSFSQNNTIAKNTVYDTNGDGIRLYSSSKNMICHNTAYNNILNGIRLEDDITYNKIDNNTVFGNKENGIWVYNNEGMVSSYISRNIITNNHAYWNTYDGIFILWSYENEISNNTACDNNFAGIVISESDNCIISYNIINYTVAGNNDRRGISLWECRSNYISHNIVYNSEFAIQINPYHSEENNLATYNKVFNNVNGFMIGGKNNEVTNNYIFSNELGIQVTGSDHHISFNSIDNNDWLGIWIESSTYITISSNIIYENSGGIQIDSSKNIFLSNNSVHNNNGLGIYIESSEYIVVSKNVIDGNGPDCGLNIRGTSYSIIRDNEIYNSLEDGIRIESGDGQCNFNVITGNTIYNNNRDGIVLGDLDNIKYNTISYNIIFSNPDAGIRLDGLFNNVTQNLLYDNNNGIFITGNNNRITGNTVYNHMDSGINLGSADFNEISGNDVHDNEINGINLGNSHYNIINNNTITNNPNEGIYLENSDYNTILRNHFISGPQANDDGSNNVFILNYWSGWTSPDADGDGIVDNPYPIGSENQDPYPLVSPDTHALTPPIINYPIGGEVMSGIITIQWFSVDSFDHSITYSLYYSPDGGSSWILMVSGLITTNYEWDTTTVDDDTTYRIKVVATCSLGEIKETISDLFTIQNIKPTTTTTTTTTTETKSSSSSTTTSAAPSIPVPGMTGMMVVIAIVPTIILKKLKRNNK